MKNIYVQIPINADFEKMVKLMIFEMEHSKDNQIVNLRNSIDKLVESLKYLSDTFENEGSYDEDDVEYFKQLIENLKEEFDKISLNWGKMQQSFVEVSSCIQNFDKFFENNEEEEKHCDGSCSSCSCEKNDSQGEKILDK